MAATRTPEEIRRSIEANRAQLGLAVEKLRGEVAEAADWRQHLRNNQKQVMIGAAVVTRWMFVPPSSKNGPAVHGSRRAVGSRNHSASG